MTPPRSTTVQPSRSGETNSSEVNCELAVKTLNKRARPETRRPRHLRGSKTVSFRFLPFVFSRHRFIDQPGLTNHRPGY